MSGGRWEESGGRCREGGRRCREGGRKSQMLYGYMNKAVSL